MFRLEKKVFWRRKLGKGLNVTETGRKRRTDRWKWKVTGPNICKVGENNSSKGDLRVIFEYGDLVFGQNLCPCLK
jgi:hypothetical protein